MRLLLASAVLFFVLDLSASSGSISVPNLQPHPCPPMGKHWRCWVATVALAHGGHGRGVEHLAVALYHRPGPARPAVLAMAGGPGSPAIASAAGFQNRLAPLLGDRDLLVIDDRGTGASDPVSCPAVESSAVWAASEIQACAASLGPVASHLGSDDVADDAEDVRHMLGLGPLVVYGVSYGSKTAVDYARRHPSSTSALVLDSPIVEDTDPFYRRSAVGAARVLGNVCAEDGCAKGSDPVSDLRTVVGRMRRGQLSAGGAVITEGALLHAIVEGGGRLHAVVGALHQAAGGNLGPLAGLLPAVVPDARSPSWLDGSGSHTMYLATSCDDGDFPWPRRASPARRATDTGAYLARLGDAAFAPFDRFAGAQYGEGRMCGAWPAARDRPAPPPVPDVPALLLVGGDDDLAPLEGAQEIAAGLPHAQLVVVPRTGHGVLRPTGPGADALRSFASGLS